MRKLISAVVVLFAAGLVNAYDYGDNSRKHKDVWGHSYERSETLDKDSDGDGVTNRYAYNDRNKNVQYDWQAPYNKQQRRGW